MPVQKNQCIPLVIESISSDGSGVGHFEGQAIFVPDTAPGDRLEVRIVKDCRRYAFGKIQRVIERSPQVIPPACPACAACGGCCFWHLDYAAELCAKQGFVQEAFRRLGGLELPVRPILPSPQTSRYRNKAQFPVQKGPDGHIRAGFYAQRSHRLIPCEDCLLQPPLLNQIAAAACGLMEQLGISAYDEQTHTGLVRHLLLRLGARTGQAMLCVVANGRSLPRAKEFCAALQSRFPALVSIQLNCNTRPGNVILGSECILLAGSPAIEDEMCGVPVSLGPLSFYQVNTPAAEQLYRAARDAAALGPGETLLDLYCGMGAIGLSIAGPNQPLVGVEVVPEAVEAARRSAARMGRQNARFLCADAGQAAAQLAREGLRPDVVLLDPPRKGCDEATLAAVCAMGPDRVVMISCNPATAARDVRWLAGQGYRPQYLQPADLFPRTRHVETIVLLSKAVIDAN